MTLGQRIAEQRKKLGLSQEALGERLGLSRQAVSKWEADAAVPEVDKLIALSKLFSVPVGWLLGVEEELAPERPEELTEAQLQMVEEIVRRYLEAKPEEQAGRMKRMKRMILLGVALAAAAGLALGLTFWGVQRQITTLRGNQTDVQGQLYDLSGQLEAIDSRIGGITDQVAEMLEQQGRILADWDLEVTGWEDLTGGTLTFSAAPKSWQAGDEGIFSVQLEGEEVARVTGTWNGANYTGVVELAAADGYCTYFILCHADGSQEYQALNTPDNMEHYYGVYLAEGLTAQFSGQVNVWDNANGLLSVTDWEIDYTSPGLFAEAEGFRVRELRCVFLINGVVADSEPVEIQGITERNRIGICSSGLLLQQQLKPGDEAELRFEVELENGTALQTTAQRWICGEYMDIDALDP